MIASPLYSIETEQALLGALMLDARAMDRIEVALVPEHFYAQAHQSIFRAIRALVDGGQQADLLAVVDALEQSGELQRIGGMAAVAEIAGEAMSAANARRHAEIVAERAMLRALAQASDEIREVVVDTGCSVKEKVDAAQAKIMALSDQATLGAREPQAIGALLPNYLKRIVDRWNCDGGGTRTGYPDLDRRLSGGMGEGALIIIAGRPGMGKTTIAMNIAEYVAASTGPALMCSQEMPNEQLIDRAFASIGRIPLPTIMQGGLSPEEHERFKNAGMRLKDIPLVLDEQGALRIEDVRRKARQTKNRHGLALIVIDYLQLMVGDGENRNREITAITGALKALAKELRIPIIALSQLSRDCEKRPDKRPQMSDLRESGAIEQDADVILAAYRDEVYNPESIYKGLAELVVLKNRQGAPGGFVPFAFQGQFSRFDSLAIGDWPESEKKDEADPEKKKRKGGFA